MAKPVGSESPFNGRILFYCEGGGGIFLQKKKLLPRLWWAGQTKVEITVRVVKASSWRRTECTVGKIKDAYIATVSNFPATH